MPRTLPAFDTVFKKECSKALKLTQNMEVIFLSTSNNQNKKIISLQELEYAYEIAYLRIFVAWEDFLETTLYRLLCGYITPSGAEPLKASCRYFPNIASAEAAILNGRDYKLWHNPDTVANRANGILHLSRYETILKSASSDIVHFANVRHRIVHSQKDAKDKFNTTTVNLCGRRFLAARLVAF